MIANQIWEEIMRTYICQGKGCLDDQEEFVHSIHVSGSPIPENQMKTKLIYA